MFWYCTIDHTSIGTNLSASFFDLMVTGSIVSPRSPLYASVVTLYDHFIQQQQHKRRSPTVGTIIEENTKQMQVAAKTKDPQRSVLSTFVPTIQLSTVSSSSSISSTTTTKEKDI